MEDCVMCANRFAGRLAHELGVSQHICNIDHYTSPSQTRTKCTTSPAPLPPPPPQVPVYLYGEAAVNPTRKALPNVRSGEYEGLIDKLVQPEV